MRFPIIELLLPTCPTWILRTLTSGCCAATLAHAAEPAWDVFSDTWAATDGLGRTLPLAAATGPPRADRTVALFYFLWSGRHGEAGPFDISRILAADPAARDNPAHPAWGPLAVPHHWGESIFSYYVADDDGVLRKHAQMLGDAGVDVIVFDVTNQLSYPESWRALGRVFTEARAAGNRTPQIAFLCPFGDPAKVVRELYQQLYQPGLYRDLWFPWHGKPLILADPERLGKLTTLGTTKEPVPVKANETLRQSVRLEAGTIRVAACLPTWGHAGSAATLTLRRGTTVVASKRFEKLADNGWPTLKVHDLQAGEYQLEVSDPLGLVGWWTDGPQRMVRVRSAGGIDGAALEFFTFRKPQPDYFRGPTGANQWGWLEVAPQHVFYDAAGHPEQATVSVAQNALDGKLGALSNPRSHGRSFHAGSEPGQAGRSPAGLNFAEQWQRALRLDPPVLFITGWNEWIASRFDASSPFHGDGSVTFVDQFDPEFSRDIEPMKGGHGDAYFYQMIDGIRRYKGTRSLPPVRSSIIRLDGKFADWQGVTPEFRDTIGDPAKRDFRGWGKDTHYREASGRHDLVAAKVSADSKMLYFQIRAADELGDPGQERWMWLLLDTDGDPKNGWLGFDYVVGRTTAGGRRSLEKSTGAGFGWAAAGEVPFAASGRELECGIPRTALGLGAGPVTIRFKWADHLDGTGEWSDFTLHGDVAPNDRFTYQAVIR